MQQRKHPIFGINENAPAGAGKHPPHYRQQQQSSSDQPGYVIVMPHESSASASTAAGHNDAASSHQWRGLPEFSSKDVRNKFVSKVYGILSVQLVFTAFFIGLSVLEPHIKTHFRTHPQAYVYSALAVFMVIYMVLVCCESTRRSYPLNYILLALATVAFALESAVLSCMQSTDSVLYAAGATAIATIVIMLIAKYSSIDITSCGCVLCVLSLVHLIVTIILILVLRDVKVLTIVLSAMGAFLMSLYLLYDTQLIMGGRRNELSPEEYIYAAIQLYVDIMQIFQYLLMLIGGASDN